MSFNKIIIVGNIGRDPEVRYTPQGVAVCDLSVATTEKKKDKAGEYQDVTTWFRVTLWRQQAENAAKYLAKGRQVYLEGRLSLEEWTDRDGNTRQTLSVQGTDMQFVGSRGDSGSSGGNYGGSNSQSGSEQEFAGPSSQPSPGGLPASSAPQASDDDDDIPF